MKFYLLKISQQSQSSFKGCKSKQASQLQPFPLLEKKYERAATPLKIMA